MIRSDSFQERNTILQNNSLVFIFFFNKKEIGGKNTNVNIYIKIKCVVSDPSDTKRF